MPAQSLPSSSPADLIKIPRRILAEVSKVVLAKDDLKEILLAALFSEGHVLIEGMPGTAKTLLAKTFATVIGGEYKRIQFTPDMLPSDVTGFYFYTPDGNSKFMPGPVFANVVLTDELNRTTARTQSALLEVMQEGQVTLEGKAHPVPQPFMVIATQIPYGFEGTSQLTEVQADRFMFRTWSGYLDRETEGKVLSSIDYIDNPDLKTVASLDDIMRVREAVKKVHVSDSIRDYITVIADQMRRDSDVLVAPSSRATISLYKGARSLAFMRERDYVIPDDVKQLAVPALEHRTRVKPEAEIDGVTPLSLIQKVMKEVPVPKAEE
jgi:MoxR-like ATPase